MRIHLIPSHYYPHVRIQDSKICILVKSSIECPTLSVQRPPIQVLAIHTMAYHWACCGSSISALNWLLHIPIASERKYKINARNSRCLLQIPTSSSRTYLGAYTKFQVDNNNSLRVMAPNMFFYLSALSDPKIQDGHLKINGHRT